MTDRLRAGAAWLEAQRRLHAVTSVTYVRGEATHTLDATIGRTTYETTDVEGLTIGAMVVDVIVAADAFPFESPEPGDQVVLDGATYEVMALADQGHWRWTDGYRHAMRIHTKEVGS